jgi:hypothetical protein
MTDESSKVAKAVGKLVAELRGSLQGSLDERGWAQVPEQIRKTSRHFRAAKP